MALRKFAVVGTGTMAAAMMPAFASGGVQVEAVISRDVTRATDFAKTFNIPLGTTDLDAVLARPEIDAVYIANAPMAHVASVLASLRAGKAVLCEKPMATTAGDLAEIVKVARQSQTLCMEGIWTLCLPAYRLFLDYARNSICGDPKSLTASFSYPTNKHDLSKMQSLERGGVLLDRGIYLIALALTIFGSVARVRSQITADESGIDTNAFLILTHQSGAYSQLATSFSSLMANTATLSCSQGIIALEQPLIGSESVTTRAWHPVSIAGPNAVSASFAASLKRRLRQNPYVRFIKNATDKPRRHHADYGDNQYGPQLAHFLALMDAGLTESDIVPLTLSTAIMDIIGQAKSAEDQHGSHACRSR